MDHDTPLVSVKKAGQKLRKALQGSQLEPDAMVNHGPFRFIPVLIILDIPKTILIKAVEDFNGRIVPVFTKVEVQSHQIVALREDYLESRQATERLQDQLTKAELFKTKSIQLEMELNETKKNENEAIRLAEIAKDDLGKVYESTVQWKKRTSELTAENKRYKDMLEKHIESVSHQLLKYSIEP
jgi:hypothetical protein